MGSRAKSSSLEAATRKARADQMHEALYVQAIGLQVEYRTGRVVAGYDSFSSRAEIERKESRVYSRDILTPSERYCVEVLGVKNPLVDIPRRKTRAKYVPVYTADGVRHVVRVDQLETFLAKNSSATTMRPW